MNTTSQMRNMNRVMASFLLVAASGATLAAAPKTQAQWEACLARAESSVNQMEVGVLGVEAKIRQMCGTPPVQETVDPQGAQPYTLVRSAQWKPRFAAITRNKYAALVDRLTVASAITREGVWLTGSGLMPHRGGSDEAAIAIDTRTQAVYAAMLEGGTKLTTFGFRSAQDAPPFLREWLDEHKR
jgi:hypothetical protein